MLDHIDEYLLRQDTLVGGRGHRRVLPIVEQRQRIADDLKRHSKHSALRVIRPPSA